MRNSSRLAVFVLCLWAAWMMMAWSRPRVSLRGFFAAAAPRQAEFERTFRAVPTPSQAQQDLWTLTRVPHVAGTPEDFKTAQYVMEQWREAGLDPKLIEYQVLLPMPMQVKVELLEPSKREGPTPEDGGSSDKGSLDSSLVPAFNAYSPSGDVTATVVYANYGLPEDYRRLQEMGIEVAGRIVIVRYGECFRGVKAYVAEQNRAGGLLIYSDPAEDGYRKGDVYPHGPWRPPNAVQRGSILYHMDYPGDPLTPGVAATREAKRLAIKDAETLPRIPTTPISYADAGPILENLGGPVAPADWQGDLPFTYHVGPGASKVHLKLEMDFARRPIWDVVAQIPGSTQPDLWVIAGNHRDAWTYGAADPNSGTAPLLALGRGLGQLLKRGWKPRRTILLASWDAEEFGLIGSTEWAEDHAERLERDAVAYLNVDIGVAGPHFGAAAVPSLDRLIREVTEDVLDPSTGRSIYAVWSEESKDLRRDSSIPMVVPSRRAPVAAPAQAVVGELGSGSDYTPFLQHLGVPSLDFGFGGAYGVYHALYDNFYWMQHFGDPSFKYSVAAAQLFGTLALRLAEADILPFDFESYGKAIERHVQELRDKLEKSGAVDQLPVNTLERAAARFTTVAKKVSSRVADATAQGGLEEARCNAVNRALLQVERDFLLKDGLPGRPWFRHVLYAPGLYTGYAAAALPGVRDAIERKDWRMAARQLELARAAIERGTGTLAQALQLLQSVGDGDLAAADH